MANVYLDWSQPAPHALGCITPAEPGQHAFAAGSMGPKVETACELATATGHRAEIGLLNEIEALLAGIYSLSGARHRHSHHHDHEGPFPNLGAVAPVRSAGQRGAMVQWFAQAGAVMGLVAH